MKLSSIANIPIPTITQPVILKSKRFWTGLLGVIFMVLVSYNPEMEDSAEQIINATLLIVGLIIGGFTLEDAAVAAKTGATNKKYDNEKI